MAEQESDDWTTSSSQLDPFLYMKTHSETADKTGVDEGKLIMENLEQAEALKKKQQYIRDNYGIAVEVTNFKNWGNTQKALLLHAKPTSRDEISSLVKAASAYNTEHHDLEPIKVGAGGAYHSWSPMFPDAGGLLINTCNLKLDPNGTPPSDRIQLNDDKSLVTISSGVTTGELMKFFLQNDVCFESDVILPTVTYGGVLSGGCHGTGIDQKSMSEWITSLTFVDGSGEFQTISQTSNPEDLKAAQVNLGLFGIVVEYTLEVKAMSTCRVENMFEQKLMDAVDPPGSPIWQSTEKLSKLLKDHWSIELFWFPFTGIMDWLLSSLPSQDSKSINIANLPNFGQESEVSKEEASLYAAQISKGDVPTPVVEEETQLQVKQQTVSSKTTLQSSQTTTRADVDKDTELARNIVTQIFDKLEVTSSAGNTSKLVLREKFELDLAIDREKFLQMKGTLVQRTEFGDLNWIFAQIAKYLAENPINLPADFLSRLIGLLWLPYLDKVWIRAINIDRESKWTPSREPGVPFWAKALDLAVHQSGKSLVSPIQIQYPSITPMILGLGFQALKLQYGTLQEKEVVKTPWAVHYRDGIDLMPVTDMEFAFPIDINNPIKAVKAIHAVIDITKNYALKGLFSNDGTNKFPLTLCLEMRVIQKGESLLSPASIGSEEHVAYIEVLSTADTPGYEEYFREIAVKWMKLGGIPHWQKQWAFLDDPNVFPDRKLVGIYEHIKRMFGQNLTDFNTVRTKYDADGLFMNETMKKLFV